MGIQDVGGTIGTNFGSNNKCPDISNTEREVVGQASATQETRRQQQEKSESALTASGGQRFKGKCFNCRKTGHMARIACQEALEKKQHKEKG